jgi:hypothetical protein
MLIIADTDTQKGIPVLHARAMDSDGWDFLTLVALFRTFQDLSEEALPEVWSDTLLGFDLYEEERDIQVASFTSEQGDAFPSQETGDASLDSFPAVTHGVDKVSHVFLPPRLDLWLSPWQVPL